MNVVNIMAQLLLIGIIDVARLSKLILHNDLDPSSDLCLKEAVDNYEGEMIERTHPAVFRSRQACLDANDYASVNPASPLIAKRAIRVDQ